MLFQFVGDPVLFVLGQDATPEQIQAALTKRAQLLGAAAPTAYGATSREKGAKDDDKEEEDERFQDPDNEVGLFAYGQTKQTVSTRR